MAVKIPDGPHMRAGCECCVSLEREIERLRKIINDDVEAYKARTECDQLRGFLRQKDEAMGVLFDRLAKAGVDCSDLIS